MEKKTPHDQLAGFCFSSAVLIAIGGIGSALAIAGSQLLIWLKVAVWPALSLQDGLAFLRISVPTTGWLGVQQVIDYVLHSSLARSVFCVAMVAFWLLTVLGSAEEKKDAQRKSH